MNVAHPILRIVNEMDDGGLVALFCLWDRYMRLRYRLYKE